MICGISSELAGCIHRPFVVSESTIAELNLSQLYLSWLSLAKPAKLSFFKTPASAFSTHVRPSFTHNIFREIYLLPFSGEGNPREGTRNQRTYPAPRDRKTGNKHSFVHNQEINISKKQFLFSVN